VKDPDTVVFDGSPITFQHDEMPAAMEKVAFAMHKDGEWTELGEDPSALVLMQLVSRGRRSLSEMTPQIEKKLQAQNLKKELQSEEEHRYLDGRGVLRFARSNTNSQCGA